MSETARSLSLLMAVLIVASLGCSSSDSGPKGSPQTVKACEDTVDAIAKVGARCGSTYEATKAEVEKAAGGGCNNVQQIRDEASLRSTCLPWLATATCAQFSTSLDPSCKSQLLKSFGSLPPGDSHLKSFSGSLDE
jgi:hypothetical protein